MDNLIITLFDPAKYFDIKGISYSTEGPNTSPGWINIDCPWCGDSLKHLGVNLETNACNCWRCGGKSIGKLVQLIENCNWFEALVIMEKFQNYNKSSLLTKEPYIPPKRITLPKEFKRLTYHNMILSDYVLPYSFLWFRGFKNPPATCQEHETYYVGFNGRDYKCRILFPIYIRKQLVTFMTRDVTGKAIKPYIACDPKKEAIPFKHTLYGYDDIIPYSNVVIVEGPIDQWRLGKESLATWGTGWTMEQVSLLRSLHPKKIFILFDSEEIAQESAKRLNNAIWFCDSEVIYLDDKKDPGELSIEEGKKVMKELIG